LLKEKKLESLVDEDLDHNYIDVEVESLIQVALLCTQSNPMERPKMSEVVRMLEGDGLAERWNGFSTPPTTSTLNSCQGRGEGKLEIRLPLILVRRSILQGHNRDVYQSS
jgi:hypothetical protein